MANVEFNLWSASQVGFLFPSNHSENTVFLFSSLLHLRADIIIGCAVRRRQTLVFTQQINSEVKPHFFLLKKSSICSSSNPVQMLEKFTFLSHQPSNTSPSPAGDDNLCVRECPFLSNTHCSGSNND